MVPVYGTVHGRVRVGRRQQEQQLAAVKGWVAQVIKGCKVQSDAARKVSKCPITVCYNSTCC